jgi:hypothetical protein
MRPVYSALVVLFTASCWQYAVQPMPLSEAARRPDDSVRVVGGLCVGTGMLYSTYTVATWEHGLFGEVRCDRFAAAQGAISIERGKDRLKLVSTLGLGLAQMTDTFWHANPYYWHNPAAVSRRAYPFDGSVGCKIGIGKESALRLTFGEAFCFFASDSGVDDFLVPLPSADAFFLQDFGPRWTAGAGIGLRGLQFNLVHRVSLRKGLTGNASANLLYYGWPVRWSRAEPRIAQPIALQAGITLGSSHSVQPRSRPRRGVPATSEERGGERANVVSGDTVRNLPDTSRGQPAASGPETMGEARQDDIVSGEPRAAGPRPVDTLARKTGTSPGAPGRPDKVVLSTRTIECRVVWSDSVYTRLRMPSGGIMMLYTDSIKDIQYADTIPIEEPEPLPPQAVDSVGASPAALAAAARPTVARAFKPATPLIVASEAGAGCLGGLALTLPISLVGGIVGVWIAGDPPEFHRRLFASIDGMNIGALVGYVAGNALSVSVVGRRFDQGGHLWASACGAVVGAAVALPLFSVDSMHTPLVMALPVLPMVGAVVGYNLSRPRPAPAGSFLNRVGMPAIGLRQGSEQQTTDVNVRLVCVRF